MRLFSKSVTRPVSTLPQLAGNRDQNAKADESPFCRGSPAPGGLGPGSVRGQPVADFAPSPVLRARAVLVGPDPAIQAVLHLSLPTCLERGLTLRCPSRGHLRTCRPGVMPHRASSRDQARSVHDRLDTSDCVALQQSLKPNAGDCIRERPPGVGRISGVLRVTRVLGILRRRGVNGNRTLPAQEPRA